MIDKKTFDAKIKELKESAPALDKGKPGNGPANMDAIANTVRQSSEKVQKIVEIEAETEKHLKNVSEKLLKIENDFRTQLKELKELKENAVAKKAFNDHVSKSLKETTISKDEFTK